ncbi:DUF1275 family protein [Glutamicibacter sp.]|uniref:DUF1275 family protein n=1 Tax=Glutamicibacter sp. TaxID=1931995 RepID=UPI002FE04BE8
MAGFVDGVGFVHFGGYFLSFMSGNSTRSSAALLCTLAAISCHLCRATLRALLRRS